MIIAWTDLEAQKGRKTPSLDCYWGASRIALDNCVQTQCALNGRV